MYKLARQGKEVERKPRPVTIYELDLLDWTPPFLQLRVVCSTGTYIRSLAHDIGERLGCGGHITVLRRTAVGDFDISDAVSLETLADEDWQAHCLPSDQAVINLLRHDATEAETKALLFGQNIPLFKQNNQMAHWRGSMMSTGNFSEFCNVKAVIGGQKRCSLPNLEKSGKLLSVWKDLTGLFTF